MLRATSAAPIRVPSNGETCLYVVPTRTRSSLLSTGALSAPGIWSSANSRGVRTSMISSKSPAWSRLTRRFFKGKWTKRTGGRNENIGFPANAGWRPASWRAAPGPLPGSPRLKPACSSDHLDLPFSADHFADHTRVVETVGTEQGEHLVDHVRCARNQQAARGLRIGEERTGRRR